jgi:hypothetical protein
MADFDALPADAGPEHAGELNSPGHFRPPPDLPRAPRLFWSAHRDFAALGEAPQTRAPEVLERLGPPPFPKSRFPFIGFLATIFDHVSAHAGRRSSP